MLSMRATTFALACLVVARTAGAQEPPPGAPPPPSTGTERQGTGEPPPWWFDSDAEFSRKMGEREDAEGEEAPADSLTSLGRWSAGAAAAASQCGVEGGVACAGCLASSVLCAIPGMGPVLGLLAAAVTPVVAGLSGGGVSWLAASFAGHRRLPWLPLVLGGVLPVTLWWWLGLVALMAGTVGWLAALVGVAYAIRLTSPQAKVVMAGVAVGGTGVGVVFTVVAAALAGVGLLMAPVINGGLAALLGRPLTDDEPPLDPLDVVDVGEGRTINPEEY